MSLSKTDLQDLKWSLGAFVLSIALGASLISYSQHYLEQSLLERQTAQRRLSDARSQLLNLQSDQENMAVYAQEYNALLMQKIIGEEPRLDWIEGLDKLRRQGIVQDFTYEIAPRQNFAPDPALETGNLQLNRSTMTLQLSLLHEGQLLHFFAALRSQLKGWFMLDGCSIARPDTESDANKPLKAECTGSWITIKTGSTP